MSNKIFWSAIKIASEIRKGSLTSSEMVDACLAQIDKVNPKLNAVVQIVSDRARQEAEELDKLGKANQFKGPLHGIPITIKDSLDTEGIVSTGGTMGRKNYIPKLDAPVVKRLRDAGAVLIAKTNTPELTLSGETNNLIYGRTNNPFDLTKSPGGSSGGSAAIIASGGSALELGSDTGGSIREPAHLCGITGIKPTSGRTPRTGHIVPYGGGVLDSLTQIGPMARYVEDLKLALPIICGPDGEDPSVVPVAMGDPDKIDISGLRIAYYTDNGVVSPCDDIVNLIIQVSVELKENKFNIIEKPFPDMAELVSLISRLRECVNAGLIQRLLKRYGTKEPGPDLSGYLVNAELAIKEKVDPVLMESIDNAKAKALKFMANYDAIICPPSTSLARPHGASYNDSFDYWGYTTVHNLLGWPGVTVRAGISEEEKLPVSVQIITAPWREDIALALAAKIETLFGGYQPPPMLT